MGIESFNLRSGEDTTRNLGRLEVCRGPVEGQWIVRAFVPDPFTAERVLARWRRQYPNHVLRLLCDSEPVEDEAQRLARLRRECLEREAAYFDRLATEARHAGKARERRYYQRCAAEFRQQIDGAPTCNVAATLRDRP